MPTSVALGTHFESFVKAQVASGRYNNVSQVVRDGLRLLQDQDDLRRSKLESLRANLQEGLASGPATPLDMADFKAEGQRLRARPRAATDKPA